MAAEYRKQPEVSPMNFKGIFVFIIYVVNCSAFMPVSFAPVHGILGKVQKSQRDFELKSATLTEDERAVQVITDHMNKNHEEDLKKYVLKWTDIGEQARKANGFSRGSFTLKAAEIDNVILQADLNEEAAETLNVKVEIVKRGFFGKETTSQEEVQVPLLPPSPDSERRRGVGSTKESVGSRVKRSFLRMSRAVGMVKSTGSIYGIPVGSYSKLPPNMRLNNVPHNSQVRSFFYRRVSSAITSAVDDPTFPRRIQVRCVFPEMNTEMDTYRFGTMLEMVRECAFNLCDYLGLRVKICIQGPMGQGYFVGLPLALNGMRTIMERMDWNPEGGEGEGDLIGKKIVFGAVGAEDVEAEDDVFIVIAPQSVTGGDICEPLGQMITAAGERPVVLINPNLKDVPSSGGLMQTRGREERMAFAATFVDCFYFRLLYPSLGVRYPITGALSRAGPQEPYVAFKKGEKDETYTPMAAFDSEPTPEELSRAIND